MGTVAAMGQRLDIQQRYTPGAAVHAAVGEWVGGDALLEGTVERMAEVAVRFARFVAQRADIAEVTPGDCEAFVHAHTRTGAPPSTATLHFRRTTVRAVFRTLRHLGVDVGDPTLDLVLGPRTVRTTRPLTDDEVTLVRVCALGRAREPLRAATAVALAEATATTREIPLVCVGDVDLAAGIVRLPGAARVDARGATLTSWGVGVLRRHLAGLDDGDPVLVVRGDPTALAAQAAACNLLAGLLDTAGLRAEPDVRPGSVRAWAGAVVHRRTGRIDAAARALGVRSLDAAADLVGFDWRAEL